MRSIGVGAEVLGQVTLAGTGEVTLFTLEWLLPSVGADMNDQASPLLE